MMLLLLLLPLGPHTKEPLPHVKVEVTPKGGTWVGQRVTLVITLYTPDFFAGAPAFEIPQIPGAIVLPPPGSPIVGSEQVGDDSFTTQRHEFGVYAQRPGHVQIPAFPIRFETNAGFGKPVIRRTVTTEARGFEAKSPPGTEGLGTVIAARNLKVVDVWKPEPKSLKVGDAFTHTLTTTAADVPGMVFPPLRDNPIDGLSIYPKTPVVNDRTERGSLTGQRSDTATYVCERPGSVTIPDRTLTWFDLDAGELKTVKLAGQTFDVTPAPNAPTPADPSPASNIAPAASQWPTILALCLAVVAGVLLLTRGVRWWRRAKARWAESESAYFTRLRQACGSGDSHATYLAFLAWLDRAGYLSLDDFLELANDPQLSETVFGLRGRVYSRSEVKSTWNDTRAFYERVRFARHQFQAHRTTQGTRFLPSLNPAPHDRSIGKPQ